MFYSCTILDMPTKSVGLRGHSFFYDFEIWKSIYFWQNTFFIFFNNGKLNHQNCLVPRRFGLFTPLSARGTAREGEKRNEIDQINPHAANAKAAPAIE
jgi:hypothetical protein